MTYAPPPMPQGPAPAHVLTVTLAACREGDGVEAEGACACPYRPTGWGGYGWAFSLWAENPATALDLLADEYDQHRRDCAAEFGAAALR